MSYVHSALVFLIDALFSMYILALLLRLLLQWARVDFHQPMTQFLLQITTPVLRPLHRFIPRWRNIDLALVALIGSLQLVKRLLLHLLLGTQTGWLGVIILSLSDLIALVLYIFIFSIIVQAVLTWVNPNPYSYRHNPVMNILQKLNEPLLAPARRFIPPLSGIDLSPLAVLLGLQLALLLIVAPLTDIGRAL